MKRTSIAGLPQDYTATLVTGEQPSSCLFDRNKLMQIVNTEEGANEQCGALEKRSQRGGVVECVQALWCTARLVSCCGCSAFHFPAPPSLPAREASPGAGLF